MFVRGESGLYRFRTIEESKELEMHTLNTPLILADYISSISQVLSPKRYTEIRDLVRIVRDIVEPHINTRIPNDMRVRPYREADIHPCIQAGLKVELMYAYVLLNTTENDGRKDEYLKEAARLEEEFLRDIRGKSRFTHAIVTYSMRMATLSYFRAAGNFTNKRNGTDELVSKALQEYKDVKELINPFRSNETKQYVETIKDQGIRGISEVLDKREEVFGERAKVDRESIDELLTMLVTDQFGALLQDILFGEMRCYALQGNYRMLKKTAEELREFAQSPENKPAPVITESATIIRYDADKNKMPNDLICTPFVSDSPPIVLEAVESIKDSFGKVSSKLWKPGDQKPQVPLVL